MEQKKNCYGQLISGVKKLKSPEYGTGEIDMYGQPVVDWSKLSEYADKNGFDKRNIEKNGKYIIEMRLPRGTEIIRYGSEMGHFTAPVGTSYEQLALPYEKETVEYHKYRITARFLLVTCIVEKGIVAPGFGSPGGGVQFLHPITIRESIKKHYLKRV